MKAGPWRGRPAETPGQGREVLNALLKNPELF
jgi:hypothetical protein